MGALEADRVQPTLIVGLGNPGAKYDQTRHNIGFAAVDALARRWQIPLASHKKFQAEFGEGRGPRGQRVRLLKPLTYMNQSGQAIRAASDWFKEPPQSVLIIYDDLDLPLGKIRLRLTGSAGGHNGMRSAIAHLGTQAFPRLRIGIGRNPDLEATPKPETISFVLGRFSAAEAQQVPAVLQLTLEAVELCLDQGVAKAMNLYNNRQATAGSNR
jgi:peptidyl-tRNA hydrolase, PTH1 family